MVLEAGSELTGKAGGNWIKLDPSGLRMGGGTIHLGGGGSPGSGSGAQPELPEGSVNVGAAGKLVQEAQEMDEKTAQFKEDMQKEYDKHQKGESKLFPQMEEAYKKSFYEDPNTGKSMVREHAGFIIKNPDGSLELSSLNAGPGKSVDDIVRSSDIHLGSNFPDLPENKNVIGLFHTHPLGGILYYIPLIQGKNNSPSEVDFASAKSYRLPGIIGYGEGKDNIFKYKLYNYNGK
jgi:hypothetical protein